MAVLRIAVRRSAHEVQWASKEDEVSRCFYVAWSVPLALGERYGIFCMALINLW